MRRMELLSALGRLDSRLFLSIFVAGQRSVLRPCARILSRSADGYLHLLIPLFLCLWQAPDALRYTALLAACMAVERPLYWLLKNTLKRHRPSESMPELERLLVAGDRFSFPSGHTSAAFVLAGTLAVCYPGLAVSLFIWATLIGISRVLLGVHYPGDTLAGAVMGSSIVLVVAQQLGGY